jgi:hypothetical protein
MLMYVVSFVLYKKMNVTVHNRYTDVELTSPIYFCNHGTCYKHSVKRVDDGAMMKIGFRFNPDQDESRGILIYAMQRNAISGHQSSNDTISAKIIEETLNMTRLLITWKIKRLEEPIVRITLVEYDNELVLSEDKLAQLYENIVDISSGHNPSRFTWLMCDNTVLMATYELEGLELKIDISEGFRNPNTKRAMWIDSKRQVPSLMI